MTAHRAPVPLPDPPLSDGRLILRPWRLPEVAALVDAWADPEVARWTGVPPDPGATAARRWIQGDVDRRAHGLSLDLAMDVDGAIAGEVGLTNIDVGARTAEIGWWVSPGHRGQHLASRAAALVAGWAVEELCVDTVLARCAGANPGSGGVARAAGFELVGDPGDPDLWRFTSSSSATLGA